MADKDGVCTTEIIPLSAYVNVNNRYLFYSMIPNIEGLHDSLAQSIIKKNGTLTPSEIVFLRKSIGWSGSDFAKNMHCDRSQVSKWEHGTVEMSKPYDLLLREMVASGKKITDYHSIELVWRRNTKPRQLRLQLYKKIWKEAA